MITREEKNLARKLPGPSQMQRVRAARAILQSNRNFSQATEVRAFMAIFHPEYPEEKLRDLVREDDR